MKVWLTMRKIHILVKGLKSERSVKKRKNENRRLTFLCLHLSPGKLDDEIAAAVFENRGTLSDMDSVTQLTSDNFHSAVAQSGLTVVLFYLKCKTESLL